MRFIRKDAAGRETHYGQWKVGDRAVRRALGPARLPGTKEGLTDAQAERELRRLMASDTPVSPHERVNVGEAGERLLRHLAGVGRKSSTLSDYESMLRVHLAPHFGSKALGRIRPPDVDAYIAAKARVGQSPKTTRNQLSLLHHVFAHAEKRGLVVGNPVKLVDKPEAPESADIRYLSEQELEALLRAAPETETGRTDRALWLTASMTGCRQGELLALRWRDIDWTAQRVRVRQNLVRGAFGTPKTKRASRSVPLADRVAGELDRHFQRSRYQGDDDLVFCHPVTGDPLDASWVRRRFKDALAAAGVRPVRFHDLRHTFGTRMAAAGVPMRTLQEWLGHRDFATTMIYADYQPGEREAELVERAFASRDTFGDTKLSETGRNSATPASLSGAENT
jgi:integrase